MLVVDDEPDNLDLLYRTFRREFQVYKAESGAEALEVLSKQGEVAVIVSDQRMPEMKGTEFLSKTVSEFPNTIRIILTGFTDIEDLVEAINSGQVYKYITKPWDPHELRQVVGKATETYDVLKQRTEELDFARSQVELLSDLVEAAQRSDSVSSALAAMAQAVGELFEGDRCIFQQVENNALVGEAVCYTSDGGGENDSLNADPLVDRALTEGQLQYVEDVSRDDSLKECDRYQQQDLGSALAIPAIYRDRILAVLSLAWKTPRCLPEREQQLVRLAADQAALVLSVLES